MSNMDEVLDPIWFVVIGLGLRYLVFVVRKDQINSSWVNIELSPQNFSNHRRAFNVPSWTAVSPGGTPEGFPWLYSFPKCEVVLVLLAKLTDFSFFSLSLFDSLELSVLKFGLVLLDIEVNWAFGWISEAIFDNRFDELDDFWDVFSDSGEVVRIFNTELFHIREKIILPSLSKFKVFYAFFVGSINNLVLDVVMFIAY